MFFSKTKNFLKSKFLIGYADDNYHCTKQTKQSFCILRKEYECINYTNVKVKCSKKDDPNVQDKTNPFSQYLATCNRKFCTELSFKNPNVFGDLSNEKYERVKMDEAEKKEQKFAERVKVPRRHRFTYNDYCKLIKSYLNEKDLKMALSVLDTMKENRDTPTLYIYRLLIAAFAVQGDIKQCFKLFKQLRDRGYVATPPVYTNLINACAESDDTETALKHLTYLREHFHERQVPLNKIHYATLIKAYSRHKQVPLAFELADVANDKGFCTNDIFAALFHVAISDKNNGLKYAVALWHKMKLIGIKPNLFHYNLLLRAIKETRFGNIKINDTLLPEMKDIKIEFTETRNTDLLQYPPALSSTLIPMLQKHISSKTIPVSKTTNENELSVNLNEILEANRLILFGGVNNLLKRMKEDNVKPNVKTVTLILDLLPSTLDAENYFLDYIEKNKLEVDITFFNMLIKRKSLRKQYKDAKAVLNEIQKHHLTPNIMTFGVLAIGCSKYWDGVELIEQMDSIGYAPNFIVLNALFINARIAKDYKYMSYLMRYILKNKLKPPSCISHTLENFDEHMLNNIEKGKYNAKDIEKMRSRYNEFKILYENWKERIGKYSETSL